MGAIAIIVIMAFVGVTLSQSGISTDKTNRRNRK